MKIFSVIILIVLTICCFSFSERFNKTYNSLYTGSVTTFSSQQLLLKKVITQANLDSKQDVQAIRQQIALSRLQLKNIDFWLRYFEPLAYKKINGPLPVEWENEVFEKFEPSYRREGGGLSLAEIYLDEKTVHKDSLLALVDKSIQALETFEADSITSQLNSYQHFFFANRLFILNLAAIYTTGFECPDTTKIVPELASMLAGTRKIYEGYNESYPDKPISAAYLEVYNKTIAFVNRQPKQFSAFDHFGFIKDCVNPLFAINQSLISQYRLFSMNNNDYTLNNSVSSIFDKSLYASQNIKGIYSFVTDEKELAEIKEIGRLLFYDPILSGNNQRSCASCHKPTEYFTDTSQTTSLQFNGEKHLPRNTPTLINSIYNHLIMLDGKHISLQGQARDVMTNPIEMNSNEKELVKKVLSCKEYKDAFKKFLKLTPGEKEIRFDHIVSAITLYYSGFSYYYSPFDDMMNRKKTPTVEVQQGFNLFMSKAQCATCHFIPGFNGVKPPYIGSEFEVLGVPGDTGFLKISEDKGRFVINPAGETMNAFRTGTLRNAAYTKPYMHNGVFSTLDEVMDFYDAGGGIGKKIIVGNQTLASDSLKLTKAEKKSIITFMQSLNEAIEFKDPPSALPVSGIKELNSRKIGGAY